MKTKILTTCFCLFLAGKASAQWTVIDPSNIAQSIVNTSKNVAHTSTTATHMVKNFQETVKIYEQGKKYYDALKSVNNLVKDARKVQQTILMVGDITDIYVNSFQKMMRDENFTVEELSAIAFGYTKLLEESNDVLTELKNVVNITTLSTLPSWPCTVPWTSSRCAPRPSSSTATASTPTATCPIPPS